MRPLLLVVRKDFLRWRRAPLMPAVFLAFPLVFSLLIGMTFGGGGGGETMAPIRLALVDDDKGIAGRLVSSSFAQGGGPVRFEVQNLDRAEAERQIEDNKVSAILRIPPGFTDSLFASKSTRLEVVKNPAQSIYPGIVVEYASVLALLGSSASRLLGEPLREIRESTRASEAPTDQFVSRVSVEMSRRLRGVGRYAFPPAITLKKPKPAAADSSANGARNTSGDSPLTIVLFVLPGMATFSLLSLAMSSMSDLRREEAAGTLARQFTAPVRTWTPVLGKAVSTCLLALLCIFVLSIVAAGISRAGISLPGFLVLALAFAVAATGFATFMQSLFQSERAGTALGSVVLMVMAMFGGSFIPLEGLPRFLRALSPFTLNYWAIEGFRKLLFENATLADLGRNLAILFLAGGIFAAAAVPMIRRRFLRGA